jgi:hypothetical protein
VKGLVAEVNVVPLILNWYLPAVGVPPVAVTVTVVVPPLHRIAGAEAPDVNGGGCVITAEAVNIFWQLFASLTVMVTEYDPAANPEIFCVVALLLHR